MKIDGVAQMVVVLTIKQISYLVVGLFGGHPVVSTFGTLSSLIALFSLIRS